MNLVHYVIVRKDLPLGVIAAQVTHAAGESFAEWSALHHGMRPPEHTTAVVLEARNAQHIYAILRKLDTTGIDFAPIYEPDAPWNGTLMAIGVYPGNRDALSHHFKGLSLLRDNDMRRKHKRSKTVS